MQPQMGRLSPSRLSFFSVLVACLCIFAHRRRLYVLIDIYLSCPYEIVNEFCDADNDLNLVFFSRIGLGKLPARLEGLDRKKIGQGM